MSKALDSALVVSMNNAVIGITMGLMLTWIGDVVAGGGEDFESAGEVEKVHLVVEGKEDLDWFCGIAAIANCTHLE